MESSATPISPSKSTAGHKRENNENDPSRLIKIAPQHRFMAPTISASLKAAPPRKKVLSERNQNLLEPDFQNLDPKESQINLEIFRDSFASEVEVYGEEIGESSFFPSKESAFKTDDEDHNLEEEEEEVEEKGCSFVGVLKFLLTLIACVLSTFYICTMNSPMLTPGLQAIRNAKDGYYMHKNQTLEGFGVEMQEGRFLEEVDCEEFQGDGFIELYSGRNGTSREVGIGEDVNREIGESFSVEAAMNGVGNLKLVELKTLDTVENSLNFDKVLVENENEGSEDKTDEVPEIEGNSFDLYAVTDEIVVNPMKSDAAENLTKSEPGNYEQSEMEVNVGVGSVDQLEVKAEDFQRMVDAKTGEIVVNGEKIEAGDGAIESEQRIEKSESEMEIKGSDRFHELELTEISESHEKKKVERKMEAVIGVSLVSIILALMGLIYSVKEKLRSSNLAGKSEQKSAAVKDKREIEFCARLQSTEEVPPKKLDHCNIYAPIVELMGEIVVGQKSRKYEAESEVLAQPVSTTSSSLSYGSFGTPKKEGGDSRVEVTTTPVRRSSRLRSRVRP